MGTASVEICNLIVHLRRGPLKKMYIDIESVDKSFVTISGAKIDAIKGLSFGVKESEFVTIVGPSGCGKSTLLRLIAGLITPSKGTITIGGQKVKGPAKKLGFVFQKPILFDWYKVLDNVLVPVDFAGLQKKDYITDAKTLLQLVELEGFEDKYPRELSGGMQQRVAIARALILDPDLLIMDEPFGALDALTRDTLNLELLRIWENKKKTVVFVTHDIQEAILLADRVIVFSDRPAKVTADIHIDLPRPRTIEVKSNKRFGEYAVEVYNLIAKKLNRN